MTTYIVNQRPNQTPETFTCSNGYHYDPINQNDTAGQCPECRRWMSISTGRYIFSDDPSCRVCQTAPTARKCRDCGTSATITDCPHMLQPRPIAREKGEDILCSFCQDKIPNCKQCRDERLDCEFCEDVRKQKELLKLILDPLWDTYEPPNSMKLHDDPSMTESEMADLNTAIQSALRPGTFNAIAQTTLVLNKKQQLYDLDIEPATHHLVIVSAYRATMDIENDTIVRNPEPSLVSVFRTAQAAPKAYPPRPSRTVARLREILASGDDHGPHPHTVRILWIKTPLTTHRNTPDEVTNLVRHAMEKELHKENQTVRLFTGDAKGMEMTFQPFSPNTYLVECRDIYPDLGTRTIRTSPKPKQFLVAHPERKDPESR